MKATQFRATQSFTSNKSSSREQDSATRNLESKSKKRLLNVKTAENDDYHLDRKQKMKNMKEYQDRIDNEFNEEFVSLQKTWKKNERRLAPLMFPALVTEQRARDGLHMSQVSTPMSSAAMEMLSSRGNQRLSKMSHQLGNSRLGARSHASRGKLPGTGASQRQTDPNNFQQERKKASEIKLPLLQPQNNDYFTAASTGINSKIRLSPQSQEQFYFQNSMSNQSLGPGFNYQNLHMASMNTSALQSHKYLGHSSLNMLSQRMALQQRSLERIQTLQRNGLNISQASTQRVMERRKQYKANNEFLKEKFTRKWMYKHGRKHLLDFGDDEIKKLKECFCSLDEDGEGTISIEELETPLIGLGFADSRAEVEEMVNEVDEDGSGEIEFDEFLLIIKNSNTKDKRSKINQFFKDMTNNSLGLKGSEDLSFGMVVQQIRRKFMMDAIVNDKDKPEQQHGQRILNNVRAQYEQRNITNAQFKSI